MTTVTITEVATSIRMSPKVARQKVRRANGEAPKPVKGERWLFPANAKRKLVALLKS